MSGQTAKLTLFRDEDILQDLRAQGCPVCNHLEKITMAFFSGLQNRLANDDNEKDQFAGELGFCSLHTWQLNSFSSPMGISSAYPKFLRQLSSMMSRNVEKPEDASQMLSDIIKELESCRVCRLIRDKEYSYLVRFVHFLEDPDGSEAYRRSQGACIRHLQQLLSIAPPGRMARLLLVNAANRFEELASSMENYASKRNAMQRYMLTRDEKYAYLRALKSIAGSRYLYTPFKSGS